MALVKWVSDKKSVEREAGLAARWRMILKAYGGAFAFAKRFGIPYSTVKGWRRIPHTIVTRVHKDKPQLFTATFCRPDLKWNLRGELVSSSRHIKKVYS